MANKTMMRIDRELLNEINKCKIAHRESYSDVVKRLIIKERSKKGNKLNNAMIRLERGLK